MSTLAAFLPSVQWPSWRTSATCTWALSRSKPALPSARPTRRGSRGVVLAHAQSRGANAGADDDTSKLYAQLRQHGAVVGDQPKPQAELSPTDVVNSVIRALMRDDLFPGHPGCKVMLDFLHPTYRKQLERIITLQGGITELNPETCQLYLNADGVRSVILNAAEFELLPNHLLGEPITGCSTACISALLRKSDMEQARATFTMQKQSPSESWLISNMEFEAPVDYQWANKNPAVDQEKPMDDLPDLPTYPDPSMRPIDVVNSIMVAMAKNDEPYVDHGSEILLRFSGPEYIETLTRFVTQNGYWEVLKVEHLANLIRSSQKLWIFHGFKDYGFRSEWTTLGPDLTSQVVYLVDRHDTVRKMIFTLSRDKQRSGCWLVKELDVQEVSQLELDKMTEEDEKANP